MRKHLRAVWVVLCLMFCMIPICSVNAAETISNGSNLGVQDYDRWASTVRSYLSPQKNGGVMRVQYARMENKVFVQYFDADYHLTDSKILPDELPLFGGFYESDSNYYLVTGQNNKDESAEVEVYRITKYDKNWNRLGATGLYDCNTTVPFDAGSCRMDMSGKYLLIRTCHEMYQSSDGKNHQSNVTIQVDTEQMKITDSHTKVANWQHGYVSHSFNQFIHLDGTQIVAVDHGDANPRAIGLFIYPTDFTTGTFQTTWGKYCKEVDVLAFAGAAGNNTTGASVGGFEMSGTSYLVTGNSIDQEAGKGSRNIFVAAVDRSSLTVNTTWLTNTTEGTSVSTPQLVKISDNRFLVLWTSGEEISYVEVDGSGNKVGQIYKMAGNLSDCVPVVTNNKIVWYTWNKKELLFYEINSNDLSKNNVVHTMDGHDYEFVSVDNNGVATFKCKTCGDTMTSQTYTSITTYWNNTGESRSYSSVIPSNLMENTTLYFWNTEMAPSDAEDSYTAKSSNPEVASFEESKKKSSMGHFILHKPGKATLTIQSKWNPNTVYEYEIRVGGTLTFGSLEVDKESPQKADSILKLTAEAFGRKGTLSYRFYLKNEDGTETVLRDYDTRDSFRWKVNEIGTKEICVDVKDGEDNIVSGSIKDYVLEKSKTSLSDVTPITFKGSAVLPYGEKPSALEFDTDQIEVLSENGNKVKGTFAFDDPDQILEVGSYDLPWSFTPDKEIYEGCSGEMKVDIKRAEVTLTAPTTDITAYSQKKRLKNVVLQGGKATAVYDGKEVEVDGVFEWEDDSLNVEVGEHSYSVVFTPIDLKNYKEAKIKVSTTVEIATPEMKTEPVASAITYGESLKESTLSGGVVADADTAIAGTYTWDDESIKPVVKDSKKTTYRYHFTPKDTKHYKAISGEVSLEVKKAKTPVTPDAKLSVGFLKKKVSDVSLPEGWSWDTPDASKTLVAGDTVQATAVYEDEENYADARVRVNIYRKQAEATKLQDNQVVMKDNNTTLVYGETLSKLAFDTTKMAFISESGIKVKGSITFDKPEEVLTAGEHEVTWTFTPNQEEYLPYEGTVKVQVEKASVEVTAPETDSYIFTIGLTLGSFPLRGGESSVPGYFIWKEGNTPVTVGTNEYEVVFVPEDARNYKNAETKVAVTVKKATPEIKEQPKASAITYGESLKNSTLSGGVVADADTAIEGTYTWDDESIKPVVKDSKKTTYRYHFTPKDTKLYKAISGEVSLEVKKAKTPVTPDTELSVGFLKKKVSDISLPEGWSWDAQDASKALLAGDTAQATAVYEDEENYADTRVQVNIYRKQAERTSLKDNKVIMRDNTVLVYGDPLSKLIFDTTKMIFVSESGTKVKGNIAFNTPDEVLPAGKHEVEWTFTPDEEDYLPCKGYLTVTVEKAYVEVTAPVIKADTASGDYSYRPGLTLKDIPLNGGTASAPGHFSWADKEAALNAGTKEYEVIFTPDDAANYKEHILQIPVTITQAFGEIKDSPELVQLDYGQTLADVRLQGGYITFEDTQLTGTYVWEDGSIRPTVKDSMYTVYDYQFVPDDKNYHALAGGTVIYVSPAEKTPTTPDERVTVANEVHYVNKVPLPKGWSWDENDAKKELAEKAYTQATALYEDQENYQYPSLTVSIYRKEHVHKYGKWTTTKKATALATGVSSRKCSLCGKKETKSIAKLKATMTLPAMVNHTVAMKVKQVNKNLKVTKMAKGDYVKSWSSSNTKIVKVSGNKTGTCTLTAGTKTGTAKITIILASGKKDYVNVKVQKTTVKTAKITGLTANITVKKNKTYTLKPALVPFTSQEKVTYKSSNTKLATVSTAGVIKAIKAGKMYVTVKSGSKSYKVNITIK